MINEKLKSEFEQIRADLKQLHRTADNTLINEKLHRLQEIATEQNDIYFDVFFAAEKGRYFNLVTNEFQKNILLYKDVLKKYSEENIPIDAFIPLQFGAANSYYFLGKNEDAQQLFQKCCAALEGIQSRTNDQNAQLADSYMSLGNLLIHSGLEFSFSNYLSKAQELFLLLENKEGIARVYNTYCNFYAKKKDYQKALESAKMAYEEIKDLGQTNSKAIYLGNIGFILIELNQLDEAEEKILASYELKKKTGQRLSITYSLTQLAELSIKRDDYQKALSYALEAEKILVSIDATFELVQLYNLLAKIYENLREFEKAYHYKSLYAEEQSKLFEREHTASVLDAKNLFEAEQKERENKLLREQKEKIEKYAHQLEINNRELSQFAHVVSHDLKEPNRMVSSYLNLLKRKSYDKLSAEEKEFFDYAYNGSLRMSEVLTDLMALSNIQNETSEVEIDLNEIIQKVLSNLDVFIKSNHAKIEIEKMPMIKANNTHMIQLFQNLISNAIKYNESENPVVKITYKKSKNEHEFSVEDNGIGIAEEFREKVFEVFQRLHSREKYSGTGIGLTICQKIVFQMKGRIWVENSDLGGSKFMFSFPL